MVEEEKSVGPDAKAKPTTISFRTTQERKDQIVELMELLGMSSQRQMVEYLLDMGQAALSLAFDRRVTASTFASLLYTLGRVKMHVILGEVNERLSNGASVKQLLREYELWESDIKKRGRVKTNKIPHPKIFLRK